MSKTQSHTQLIQKKYSERLSEKGFLVEIIASPFINVLRIVMRDMEVFRGDIRHLLFNIPWERDLVCQRVVEAVVEADRALYTEQNAMQFPSVHEGMRYQQIMLWEEQQGTMDRDVEIIYNIEAKKPPAEQLRPEDPCEEIRLLFAE